MIKGVGYIGEGSFRSTCDGKHTKEYNTWFDMLSRCYDPKYQIKYPTYLGCSVCVEWYNFQTFCDWYTSHRNYNKDGFELDKDLMYIGNKIYSPSTCDLIPRQINSSIIVPKVSKNTLYTGVHWCAKDRRYIAQIRIDAKRIRLGAFKPPEEASRKYIEAKRKNLKVLAERHKSVIDAKVYQNLLIWI